MTDRNIWNVNFLHADMRFSRSRIACGLLAMLVGSLLTPVPVRADGFHDPILRSREPKEWAEKERQTLSPLLISEKKKARNTVVTDGPGRIGGKPVGAPQAPLIQPGLNPILVGKILYLLNILKLLDQGNINPPEYPNFPLEKVTEFLHEASQLLVEMGDPAVPYVLDALVDELVHPSTILASRKQIEQELANLQRQFAASNDPARKAKLLVKIQSLTMGLDMATSRNYLNALRQTLVAMGDKAVPPILKRLKESDQVAVNNQLRRILRKITGEDRSREDWLKKGEEKAEQARKKAKEKVDALRKGEEERQRYLKEAEERRKQEEEEDRANDEPDETPARDRDDWDTPQDDRKSGASDPGGDGPIMRQAGSNPSEPVALDLTSLEELLRSDMPASQIRGTILYRGYDGSLPNVEDLIRWSREEIPDENVAAALGALNTFIERQ